MNNEVCFHLLQVILETVDKVEYPESHKIVEDIIHHDMGAVNKRLFEIASALFDADSAKQMHPAVASFVETVYLEEIEKGNAAAACSLGALYYTGRIGEQNFAKAVQYYKIAAEGSDRHLYLLGTEFKDVKIMLESKPIEDIR